MGILETGTPQRVNICVGMRDRVGLKPYGQMNGLLFLSIAFDEVCNGCRYNKIKGNYNKLKKRKNW